MQELWGLFPVGDASSRWLIDIRADLSADDYDRGGDQQRRRRSARRAGAPDRADRSFRHHGRSDPASPSAARAARGRAIRGAAIRGTAVRRAVRGAAARRSARLDAARECARRAAQREALGARGHSERGPPLASRATGAAVRRLSPRANSEQPYHAPEQAHDPSRYDDALYGQLKLARRIISARPPIPTIPTPIRTATRTSPSRSASAAVC